MRIEFANAGWLQYLAFYAFMVIPLGAAWLRRRWAVVRFYGRGRLHGQLRSFCFILLLFLTGLSLGVSLCSPYIRREEPFDVLEPLEMVVLLDISKSMLASATVDPCGPSRLTAASWEAASLIDLMERERGAESALVVFARYAYPAVPVPTDDYRLLRRRLVMETDIANVMKMPEGSDHWYALERAVHSFDEGEHGRRALAIITDGEPDMPGAERAGRRAGALRAIREKGVEVYVVGVGKPGLVRHVPLSRLPGGCPDEAGGYMVQRGGEGKGLKMTTTTSTASLKSLASELGGRYILSTHGGELAGLVRDTILKERRKLGVAYGTTLHDLSAQLIVAALSMMAMMMIIRTP